MFFLYIVFLEAISFTRTLAMPLYPQRQLRKQSLVSATPPPEHKHKLYMWARELNRRSGRPSGLWAELMKLRLVPRSPALSHLSQTLPGESIWTNTEHIVAEFIAALINVADAKETRSTTSPNYPGSSQELICHLLY